MTMGSMTYIPISKTKNERMLGTFRISLNLVLVLVYTSGVFPESPRKYSWGFTPPFLGATNAVGNLPTHVYTHMVKIKHFHDYDKHLITDHVILKTIICY